MPRDPPGAGDATLGEPTVDALRTDVDLGREVVDGNVVHHSPEPSPEP